MAISVCQIAISTQISHTNT